ncbi:MAG: hypothetical protein V1850_01565 [Candidatus Bathyarchaeota archaeon]
MMMMMDLVERSSRIPSFLKENLGAPLVIGFMSVLLVCAGLLAFGNSVLANDLAIYAYYLLVGGVVLQLVSFLRLRKEEE